MRLKLQKLILKASLFGAFIPALLSNSAVATTHDNYPNRPISMVVGYAPGGATDMLARLIAKALTDELEQPVIVENKAGANSNIAAEHVVRSKKDGYTIFVGIIGNTINQALYSNPHRDFIKDFAPIGMMASISNVLVVNPKLPVNSVQDYIDYAKRNPGQLTCASSGIGSSIHMSCELFMIQTGTNLLHVPYRGSGPAVTDLLGGQVDSMFDNVPSSLPHIQAGNLRPIATTTKARVSTLPNTPTFTEEGVKGFVVEGWFGLYAPAGTPGPIISKLNHALNKALVKADIISTYDKNNFTVPEQPNSPDSFKQYTQSEIDKWAEVVKKANLAAN